MNGSIIENVIKYGVGGININECRVSTDVENNESLNAAELTDGRFPSNTILTYNDDDFDEVCGGFPYTKNSKRSEHNNKDTVSTNTYTPPKAIYTEDNTYGDSGSASRYYYCAKASKKDRDDGLDIINSSNSHPTVKPTELMQYLIRLVSPKGAIILDTFMGSGSTGKAVIYENNERNANYKFIGIEQESEYCKIAEARIQYACGDRVVEKLNATTGEVTQVVEQKLKQNKLF